MSRSSLPLASAPNVSTADGPVAVTVARYELPPDSLRPIAKFAEEWGVEPTGLYRAAIRVQIAVRIGRQWCARRSDLLRLPELLAKPALAPASLSADPRIAYAETVGRKAGAR